MPGESTPIPPIARLRIEARLRRRHQLITESIDVAGRTFRFTRVADPKVVLDSVIRDEAAGKAPRMPYWAELWESAIAIGERLLHQATGDVGERKTGPASAEQSVLDLGCGMGFSGMVAAAAGHRVLFADIEPEALLFAELNAWPWRQRCRFRRLNWQTDRLDERFGLILGADVLYERGQREHLEPFWRHHLLPGGRVLLGEPGRQSGSEFADWIRARGWILARSEIRLGAQRKTIRLFELTPAP